jgi:hypothetical protein
MKRMNVLTIGSMLLFLSACSYFSNKPSEENIAKALIDKLPVYTEIVSIDIKVMEEVGSKVDPKYEMRFVGKIKLLKSTYEKIGHIDGNVDSDVLRELIKKGTTFELFGKATSILRKEQWVTKINKMEFSIENFGQIIGKFSRPVIEDSPEHKEAIARYSEWVKAKESALAKAKKEEAEKVEKYAKVFSGKWKGSYICGQGSSGLTLEITPASTSLGAVFNFYPIPQNTKAKSGSFSLIGQFTMDGSFKLKPNRWIERPAGYRMVGMAGNINIEKKVLVGSITERGCSNFQLQKQ